MRRLPWVLIAAAAAYGVVRAIQLAWVSDDAFISFRYARNLADGLGLVYNAGERVEGYTNLLWTLACAQAMAVGIDPVGWSKALGIVCFAGVLAGLVFFSRRLRGPGEAPLPFLPLAAIGFALHHHAEVWATGGLETMLFALLATWGFVALVVAARPGARRRWWLLAGALLALASLTRPDGVVLYAAAALWALWVGRRRGTMRPVAILLLPALALVAHLLWRLSYYGYPLPNTYYAKSAGSPRLGAGLHYAWLFFRSYYVLLAAPAAAYLVLRAARDRGGKAPRGRGGASAGGSDESAEAVALAALMAAAYLAFVVWVGGDFMFARFLVPIVPLLYVMLEVLVRRLPAARLRWAAAFAVAALTLVPWLPGQMTDLHGVVEERRFYPPESLAEARRYGETLRRHLAGTKAQVAIFGSQAMLAYYGAFPVAIEANAGLTDEYIAHLPPDRSRAGHEKKAPIDYLVRRGVNFAFDSGLFRQHVARQDPTWIRIGEVTGRIIVYDPALMARLARSPEVEFTPVEQWVDGFLAGIEARDPREVLARYQWLRSYYWDRHPDPEREAAFRRWLPDSAGARPREPAGRDVAASPRRPINIY